MQKILDFYTFVDYNLIIYGFVENYADLTARRGKDGRIMEVLATARANDFKTGKELARVEGIFTCDECENYGQFTHAHGDDIEEFLMDKLREELGEDTDFIVKFDCVELEDNDDEEEDEEDEE